MALARVGNATNSGSGTAASITYTSVSGNYISAYVVWQSGAGTLTNGTGWTRRTLVDDGTLQSAWLQKVSTGSTSETVISWVTAGLSWSVILVEHSGQDTTPLDVENNAINASATPLTTPTVTPTSGLEEVALSGAVTGVPSSTFSADQVNASATGVTSYGTVSSTHAWDLIVASTSGTYQGRSTPSATATIEHAAIVMVKAPSGAAVPWPLLLPGPTRVRVI